jgi:DtxR family transcriptional regulator, Mn-dependent transcriptional regulator
MNSFTEENYLKAIYKLSGPDSVEVSTNSLAEKLGTKPASVTDMLRKLSAKKLINYQKYQGVSLTQSGKKIAIQIIRRHRLWELFLVKNLEFGWDKVHDIAEQLEHIESNELIDRLEKYMGFPRFDPHGDPIPDNKGKFPSAQSTLLSEATGTTFIMTGVVDHGTAFLQYLDKIGLGLGDEIKIKERNPYDHSLNISINKKHSVFISNQVARNILVAQ